MRSKWFKLRVVGVVLGTLLDTAPAAAAQPTPQRALLILSKTNHTLAIVDPATLKVIERVPVGPDPHEVIASSDGKTACVSNPGFGRFHMDWIQTGIPVAQGAEGFDVSPDGKELWTANPQGSLSIIGIANKKVTATIDAKILGAHRLKFTPDGKRVLIVSVRTGDRVVYDAGARKEIKRLNIGHGAAMLMDAGGARAFVACTPDNYVAAIDLKTLEVTGHIDVGGRPDGLSWAVRRE